MTTESENKQLTSGISGVPPVNIFSPFVKAAAHDADGNQPRLVLGFKANNAEVRRIRRGIPGASKLREL
jgi:hypothetical protein